MISLSSTLETAQQAKAIDALVKVVLTFGEDSYAYTKSRILDIRRTEEPYSQKEEITLDNSDGALTALDLQGFKAVTSFGIITGEGEEYEARAPLWVMAQTFGSNPPKSNLACMLTLIGIPDLMAEDKASETYAPESDDTNTAKDLIDAIAGATLTCFSLCTAYETVWEDGYNDLADTYYPRDAFRIYTRSNRLSALRRLLEDTGNVMRVEADGKIHIFKPVTSGTTYDYEYSLNSGHTFFSKAYRKRLVDPNYIVVQSESDDDPQYSGYAKDTDSFDRLPKYDYYQRTLENPGQATAIAEAILQAQQMWSEAGSAEVPLNIGAEVFDYVKVTDEFENDTRIGNLGHIAFHYNANKQTWLMTFSFGNWMTVQKYLANSGITTDDLEQYFSRLRAKDAYIEHLLVEEIDAYWIDPEGNIDWPNVNWDTFDFDTLPDGEYYHRTKTLHLDAETGLTLEENRIYYIRFDTESDEAGISRGDTAPTDPTTGQYWIDTSGAGSVIKRWTGSAWTTIDQDEIDSLNRGILTLHTKTASLSTDGLVLLDEVHIGDDYDLLAKADLSAHHLLLSSVVQSSSYRTSSDTEKSTWNAKNKTYYQTAAPATGMIAGDLWFDTDDGYKAYRYSGAAWGAVQDGEISELRTDVDAGSITLSSLTTISGAWYNQSGLLLSALFGIRLYGGYMALSTHPTYADALAGTNIQCYVGTDGKLYAGGGTVVMDSGGLTIAGQYLIFKYGANIRGYLYGGSSILYMASVAADIMLYPASGYNVILQGGNFISDSAGARNLGSATYPFGSLFLYGGYIDLPVRSSNPTWAQGRAFYISTTERLRYGQNTANTWRDT